MLSRSLKVSRSHGAAKVVAVVHTAKLEQMRIEDICPSALEGAEAGYTLRKMVEVEVVAVLGHLDTLAGVSTAHYVAGAGEEHTEAAGDVLDTTVEELVGGGLLALVVQAHSVWVSQEWSQVRECPLLQRLASQTQSEQRRLLQEELVISNLSLFSVRPRYL